MADNESQDARSERALQQSRLGVVFSLAIIAVALAAAVALLIPAAREFLPVLEGLDYRFVQLGVVLLTLVFGFYTLERESRLKRLVTDLVAHREESARMGARLEMLDQVRAEKDTVTALLLASADGMIVVDRSKMVTRMNPAMEALTGTRADDGLGRQCWEVLGCQTNGSLACGSVCPFEDVFSLGETLKGTTYPITRDGEQRWLSGAYAPVQDSVGRAALGIGSLRDVTDAKEMENLQQDFVSIVSHELRGPLTAIKGFVKTLVLKGDRIEADVRKDFLSTIDEQSDRLNQLVEDLLNVSKIEGKRLRIKIEDLGLEAITSKLIAQFQAKWPGRKVRVESAPDLPNARVDPDRYAEILINLVDNAIKYSPAGGDVRVLLRPSGSNLEVSVEDSGIGLSPEDSARLFEKFVRIATPATREIGGTGLGLYIVRSLVEAHGGQIFVTSAPEVGSTFTFTLPATP